MRNVDALVVTGTGFRLACAQGVQVQFGMPAYTHAYINMCIHIYIQCRYTHKDIEVHLHLITFICLSSGSEAIDGKVRYYAPRYPRIPVLGSSLRSGVPKYFLLLIISKNLKMSLMIPMLYNH